jgi:purine-binding chemotaxis protein CheW
MRALLIPVGPDLYAVPMSTLREVMATPKLCVLPTGPPAVVGLFNLRGEIVPMYDTAALLGLGRLAAWPFVAVVRTSLGPAGMGASGLPESTVLDEVVAPSETRATTGIYSVGHRLAALIDVDALVVPAEDRAGVLTGPATTEL